RHQRDRRRVRRRQRVLHRRQVTAAQLLAPRQVGEVVGVHERDRQDRRAHCDDREHGDGERSRDPPHAYRVAASVATPASVVSAPAHCSRLIRSWNIRCPTSARNTADSVDSAAGIATPSCEPISSAEKPAASSTGEPIAYGRICRSGRGSRPITVIGTVTIMSPNTRPTATTQIGSSCSACAPDSTAPAKPQAPTSANSAPRRSEPPRGPVDGSPSRNAARQTPTPTISVAAIAAVGSVSPSTTTENTAAIVPFVDTIADTRPTFAIEYA